MRELSRGHFDDAYAGPRDPAVIVKGWAVDRAVELLARHGVATAQLNAGGRVTGDRAWRLGIADPRTPGALLDVVAGRELSPATSSREHRGDHIVAADDSVLSASVLGPDLAWADGLATALVAAGGAAPELLLSLDPAAWSGLLLCATARSGRPRTGRAPYGRDPFG